MTEPRRDPASPPVIPARRLSPRGLAEGLATTLIVLGIVMMMQPFLLLAYSWSFTVILVGTVLFVFGSKLPE